MDTTDPLDLFLPPVREWFRSCLGKPTTPQRSGWPAIAAGLHTLILAPTGSGKTLAAFLACLDALWRQPTRRDGVRVLYISPLKALNNDIHRNLQVPLKGVEEQARATGYELPNIEAAVRTGDTPTAERARLVRRPPHVLITTPESLHLMLTSQARETLRDVTHVIIDEIHALCTNKRGVFLALLLERLEAIQRSAPFTRIGLSATQRPLEEVARYLGGLSRAVHIVDAGLRKDIDLGILSPVEQFGPLPEQSVWPCIHRLLTRLIHEHRSTLIFANDRRSVERITSCLNEETEIARAHHGSVALELRHGIEEALKAGNLPAVVATASLEMGIDMGAVDLVAQVASPGNVARALQRVGRAGHLVGQQSKGRFIPRTAADLLEQAVLVREMTHGHVESIRVPTNCLDVLAQQVVAMAAMDAWNVPAMFSLVRKAYPFRDLTPAAFEATLEMASGRYRFDPVTNEGARPATTMEALQPRVSWDRVNNRIVALPGSQSMALVNGGTIPDTGNYAAVTQKGVRIGELDEEFIYERRVGDSFLLGTSSWRLERIETDRVVVSPAQGGADAIVPFWRGEGGGRSSDLGEAIGCFLRELQSRIDAPDCGDWLQNEFGLDSAAARSLKHHVARQLVSAGCLPTDRTLLVEASRDQLGDWQVILLSPLGARLHLGLRFAIEASLRRRLGYHPQCLHHDDGILVRLADAAEPVLDLLAGITAVNVEELILDELADSALFALRFRQNAARALLLPRGQAGKRAPLWLQRLRSKDLLQVARRHPDFPIVVETLRECLHDHLDVPRLKTLLNSIHDRSITIVERRSNIPSPFASGLLFAFTAANLYESDNQEKEGKGAGNIDRDLLGQLLAPDNQEHLLDPRAIGQVDRRLRGSGHPPRSGAEMAEWLRRVGDAAPDELEGPMEAFVHELAATQQATMIELPRAQNAKRWILAEERSTYERAFGLEPCSPVESQIAGQTIFARYLTTRALVGLTEVLERYPFERTWAERQLGEWVRAGRTVRLSRATGEVFAAPENLEQVRRGSLGLLRREVVACQPGQFVEFVLRWQRLHPTERRGGADGLADALHRLQGLSLPVELWEQTVLPARVPAYQSRWLDEWVAGGQGVWLGVEGVALLPRETLGRLSPPGMEGLPDLNEEGRKVGEALQKSGALFPADLAVDTGLSPSQVRAALWEMCRRGLVTTDQFEVARRGEPQESSPEPRRGRTLRRAPLRSEGRWSLLRWGRPTPEEQAHTQALMLLERYGVVARELALLDPRMLPWRILYEVLSRLELAGDVRRGYFVEGLSGAQFALPEASEQLQALHLPSVAGAEPLLVHSQDPANLYGSGAPFDVPLLDGGTRSFLRRPGNWLVLKAGRPVLLVEAQGRRLTALASASKEDIAAAARTLPAMFDNRSLVARHKVTVDEWNGQPVTASPGKELLEAAGFVRDLQGMTLYAAWR